jgi:hypothetical protein
MLEKKNKHAKYLTGISSNAVFIHILVNTPTKVKKFPGSEGVKWVCLYPTGAGIKFLSLVKGSFCVCHLPHHHPTLLMQAVFTCNFCRKCCTNQGV